MTPFILFCKDPSQPGKPDPDFEGEYIAAREAGYNTILFDFDELERGNASISLKDIHTAVFKTDALYRGWMLTPQRYMLLYETLLAKNFRLINTPVQYQNCHYLPDSLKYIINYTPQTEFIEYTSDASIDILIEKTSVFNGAPVIIKDYVKSEKHYWDSACFVPDSSDILQLKNSIYNFLKLRDKYLNVGIVLREFLSLKHLTVHSKSGMPLTEEYRLFFYKNKLVGIYDYWEEGEYDIDRPDTSLFEEIAGNIDSNFFSMDIARCEDDSFIIIELGDGQVSGLPDKLDRRTFYMALTV